MWIDGEAMLHSKEAEDLEQLLPKMLETVWHDFTLAVENYHRKQCEACSVGQRS